MAIPKTSPSISGTIGACESSSKPCERIRNAVTTFGQQGDLAIYPYHKNNTKTQHSGLPIAKQNGRKRVVTEGKDEQVYPKRIQLVPNLAFLLKISDQEFALRSWHTSDAQHQIEMHTTKKTTQIANLDISSFPDSLKNQTCIHTMGPFSAKRSSNNSVSHRRPLAFCNWGTMHRTLWYRWGMHRSFVGGRRGLRFKSCHHLAPESDVVMKHKAITIPFFHQKINRPAQQRDSNVCISALAKGMDLCRGYWL